MEESDQGGVRPQRSHTKEESDPGGGPLETEWQMNSEQRGFRQTDVFHLWEKPEERQRGLSKQTSTLTSSTRAGDETMTGGGY